MVSPPGSAPTDESPEQRPPQEPSDPSLGARPAAPDWLLGTLTGLGGLAGGLLGAHVQARLDERLLTGVLAVLATAVAVARLLRG